LVNAMHFGLNRPILGYERILKQNMGVISTVGRSTRMHCIYQKPL